MGVKYTYDPATCKFEPVRSDSKQVLKSVGLFLLLALIIATLGTIVYLRFNATPQEEFLAIQNEELKASWSYLDQQLQELNENLAELSDREDFNYRTILDLQPLSPEERLAGTGGSDKSYLDQLRDFGMILNTISRVEKLKHQLNVELESYKFLNEVADRKVNMWLSRPAIQPISNKELDHLHTTYGSRRHPIFGYVRPHKGLDFSASRGTPVYATGDGKVIVSHFSISYGNVIYVDHGFDYETRYAHLSKFNVEEGQTVKRGEIIGYVGNTGISASPHLHYEVLFKGDQINPINFFQRDLNNKEYEKLIEIGNRNSHSLD